MPLKPNTPGLEWCCSLKMSPVRYMSPETSIVRLTLSDDIFSTLHMSGDNYREGDTKEKEKYVSSDICPFNFSRLVTSQDVYNVGDTNSTVDTDTCPSKDVPLK